MNDETHDPVDKSPMGDVPNPAFETAAVERARSALRQLGEHPTALPEATAGAMIAGRYKLLELIGEGGMGIVWMAEQRSPVRRPVAIKLIKAGMDSTAVLARFDAERQALAMMDHPNIARIFDGGTTDRGHPYFVMELVRGLPLTRYCDERRMAVHGRLDLFMQICGGVQHAHQKGIIHRDLKPANLLVTEHDGTPVPKIIDFGLVKALGGSAVLTEQTMHTSYGAVAGTPHYMAPEQVAINALDIDTRADIYALGVILYELLAGTTPHELKQLNQIAWEEVRRVIREEDPLRPSLRITQSATIANLAATRHTEPARLSKLVAGELDWIVMKALEKDRHRRYGTASDLAADLQRHLAGDRVLAAPPTAAYRLKKLVRKHKVALSTAAAVFIVLIAGVLVSSWQAIRASRAEAVARNKTAEVQTQKDEAQKQRDSAVAANKQAEAESATIRRQLADSYIQSGSVAWNNHDHALAALWFVEALKLDQGDPRRERMDRIRLNDSFARCPLPRPSNWKPIERDDTYFPEMTFRSDGTDASHVNDMTIELGKDFSSDMASRHLLIGFNDHSARVWDDRSGKPLTGVFSVPNLDDFRASHDSSEFATHAAKGGWQIWDTATGAPIGGEVNGDENRLEFSPDGKLLAVSDSASRTVQVLNARTLKLAGVPIGAEGFDLAFSANNKCLLLNDGSHLRVWNVGNGTPIGPAVDLVEDYISGGVAISPDGRRICVLSSDTPGNYSNLHLWNACTGAQLYCVSVPDDHLAFSDDGRWVGDSTVKWDTQLDEPVAPILRRASALSGFMPTQQGKIVVTAEDKEIQCCDAETLQPVSPPLLLKSNPYWFPLTPDGTKLVGFSVNEDPSPLISINLMTGQVTHGSEVLGAHEIYQKPLMSPDGAYLLVWRSEGERGRWELYDTHTLKRVGWPEPKVTLRGFSPDGRALVGWNDRGDLSAWDVETGEPITNPPPEWRVVMAGGTMCPDGSSYVSSDAQGVRIRDLRTGKPISPALPSAYVGSNNNLPGPDATVLTWTSPHSLCLWDAHTAQPLIAPLIAKRIFGAAIDPDGTSITWAFNPTYDSATAVMERWSIAPTQLSLADAETLAELLSGRRIDDTGSVVPLETEQFDRCLAEVTKRQAESPDQYPAPAQVGWSHAISSEYRDNVEARFAAATSPEEKQRLINDWAYAGGAELICRHYNEAALLEEKVLDLDKENLCALDHLAHAYFCLGRFSEALAIYQKYAGRQYQTDDPSDRISNVGADLSDDLKALWIDRADDPAVQQIAAIRQVISQATDQPRDIADKAARLAMEQFHAGHVAEARTSLRKAARAGQAEADDSSTGKLVYAAKSLIDPASTQPTDSLADDLDTAAWDILKNPAQPSEKYTYALELIRRSLAAKEGSSNLDTLAFAQFRTGDYKGALDSSARSEATDFVAQDNHVYNLTVSAMAQQMLGLHEQARAALQKVIAIAKEPGGLTYDETQIFNEAAAMIDPASTQPTTAP
ncbi:MAG TPA: protein kinase [Tepidisphaeraceae bacterium]|jgi:serine/threonine protein kinase/WD40 repeat protein/tetratricopeptide (TPR) repeat protein|nr:protein kinase [Tepidisphaeraceae bacterium]